MVVCVIDFLSAILLGEFCAGHPEAGHAGHSSIPQDLRGGTHGYVANVLLDIANVEPFERNEAPACWRNGCRRQPRASRMVPRACVEQWV